MRISKLFTCVIAALALLFAAGCSSQDSAALYYRQVPGYGYVPVGATVDPATGFVTYPQTYSPGAYAPVAYVSAPAPAAPAVVKPRKQKQRSKVRY
ncbi:MAG: hypothetical protein LBS30_01395, partial [Planctomycetota bacterium]|nr:hypothetical protein [Planctomycetota bacterium]